MWPTYYIPTRELPRVVNRFYLTTPPYPVEVSDSMKCSGDLIGGYGSTKSLDEMAISTTFLGGTLVTRLVTHTQPEDEMVISTTFLGGVLIDRLIVYEAPPEELAISTTFLGGTLKRILITYSNWPLQVDDESLQLSTAFLGGTLAP